MTNAMCLASRTFTEADQIQFAEVSGDRNPMHLDAIKARRTQAGLPVVHGVHLVLWALDVAVRKDVARSPMLRLRANFKRFVALGETVALVLAKQTEANVQLHFVVAGLTVAQISLDFGSPVRSERAAPRRGCSRPGDAPRSDAGRDGRIVGQAIFRQLPRHGRRDVPGGVRLARLAPGRRVGRHLPVGWHGVPWAALHLR